MRHPKPAPFVLLPIAALCSACLASVPDPVQLTYAPGLGIDLARMTRTPSGLFYQDITVGSGTAAARGRQVRVLYRGWLHDGTAVDDHLDENDPLVIALGAGSVIPGWDEGISGMRAGGVRVLVVPPSLAYGSRSVGPIPPNATLVFRIQLVGVM